MNILIVDGSSAYARAWYAAQTISSDPIEAVKLTVNTVLALLDPNSDKIGTFLDSTLFAWDSRQNKSKERDEKPKAYHETKELVKDVLALLFNTVNAEDPDFEGDDIVATAAYATRPKDVVYICSGDKDLMQLHGGNCQYYSLTDKAMLHNSYITRKFGNIKRPSHVAIYLAIVGDPVDNIKGITRYGPKKCKELFESVTSEMEFKEAIAAITKQLPADKEEEFYAALNRTLLRTDIPGVPKPSPLKWISVAEVRDLGIPGIANFYEQVREAYT